MINCGERDLIAAVLERALQDVRGEVKDVSPKDRQRVQRDARMWIFRNAEKAFSFKWCADALGVDPYGIRKQIKKFCFRSEAAGSVADSEDPDPAGGG
jgi:hypothetical protein